MEIEILSKKEEKLFGRNEIVFSIISDNKTVSKQDALVVLCKKLNLKPDSTVITEIKQGFGARTSVGYAHAYLKADDIKRFEEKRLLDRASKKSGGAEAAEPEVKKEEAKAPEEKKEETVE